MKNDFSVTPKSNLEVTTIIGGSNETRKGLKLQQHWQCPSQGGNWARRSEESEVATKSNSQRISKLLVYGSNGDSEILKDASVFNLNHKELSLLFYQ